MAGTFYTGGMTAALSLSSTKFTDSAGSFYGVFDQITSATPGQLQYAFKVNTDGLGNESLAGIAVLSDYATFGIPGADYSLSVFTDTSLTSFANSGIGSLTVDITAAGILAGDRLVLTPPATWNGNLGSLTFIVASSGAAAHSISIVNTTPFPQAYPQPALGNNGLAWTVYVGSTGAVRAQSSFSTPRGWTQRTSTAVAGQVLTDRFVSIFSDATTGLNHILATQTRLHALAQAAGSSAINWLTAYGINPVPWSYP